MSELDFGNEHQEETTHFVEVILPVPVPRLFTYRVPRELNDRVQVGQRVIVQFGDRRILTGIVDSIHEHPPKEYEAKYLLDVLEDEPAIQQTQLKLFHWITSYYMCSIGEVMNAALPSGLKLSSESMVQIHPSFDWENTLFEFSEKEETLLSRLQTEPMSYSDISKLLGIKTIYSILKSLTSKEAIILYEEVIEKYKPKTEKRIRLREEYLEHKQLEKVFDELSKKPKQEAILLKYLQEIPILQDKEINTEGISREQLLSEGQSESSLKTLVKHGILEEYEVVVSRLENGETPTTQEIQLTEDQVRAQNEILDSFSLHEITLLHGITGSGKTEIYINLIKKAIEGGNQVLYLLPEIALTTQIVSRLQKVFGNTLGVYHSKFSDNERVEVWNGIVSGRFKFVIGVRSSVFLPFDNLGLVIIDEEHDPSYKQQEPAPRYHARDVAMVMANIHHAKVLLGSATPCVETFYQTQAGKYGYVNLTRRYGEAQLPQVVFADMRTERRDKKVKGEFSSRLLSAIEEALSKKEQAIIFQNRRGYSPMVQCEDCQWVPKCVNCAVSLTYHQYKHALICHYCGYKESLPSSCPSCTSKRLLTSGYGTEKLVEELKLYFPNATVQRMDLDTTRSKTSYEKIIEGFESGETDILVGTQMVTKGLDFNKVSLVGVFNADRMMHFPDFRSYERAFQLLTQVSGRAGRREKPGKVIIQTSHVEHPILNFILNHSLDDFYNLEMEARKDHLYPPFSRLIELTTKHTDRTLTRDAAAELSSALRQSLHGIKILGPGEPMISKIRNQYLMTTLLKIPRDSGHLAEIKSVIQQCIERLNQNKEFRTVRVVVDVDPY